MPHHIETLNRDTRKGRARIRRLLKINGPRRLEAVDELDAQVIARQREYTFPKARPAKQNRPRV